MANEPKTAELAMDAGELYREDIYTDRKAGTIRVLTPVLVDGTRDESRLTLYMGQAQMLTPVGAVPLSFDIEAANLQEAIDKFPESVEAAVAKTIEEVKELRRQAASSIVVPDASGGSMLGRDGLPGGGKIKLP